MLGAIAGDIIGSVYEGKKHWQTERNPDFMPLFASQARYTDDTVLSIAVAEYRLYGTDLVMLLKDAVADYPTAGFGRQFKRWALSTDEEAYGSWGNGAAMRVSPIGFSYPTLDEVLAAAKQTAIVTHTHPTAIAGAQAIAAAIFLARTGASKEALAAYLERKFGYDLDASIDELRLGYSFTSAAQGSVPHAIVAFLDSTDYEHAVRLAVSLGGDTDTLACMAGGIAQAYYGAVPEDIRQQVWERLDDHMRTIIAAFVARFMTAEAYGSQDG
jgi:ADP-ribosylglycohydrolase